MVALFALCCSSLLIATPVLVIFAFLILHCLRLRLYLFANLTFVSVFLFFSLRYLAGRELHGESPESVIEVNGSASG